MARLTYIGNFKPPHSTENHVAQTFRELGWEVTWAQEDALSAANGWASMVSSAERSELVLYTRTWGLPPQETTALWRRLEALGVRTASLHLDLFIGLDRERLVSSGDPLFTTGLVCTADGDHDAEWAAYGVNHRWLRPGVLRAEARPGSLDARWAGADVAFVGSSARYHREWPYRQQLLSELGQRFRERFLVIPRPGQPAVRGQALNDLYASIPVIVGDSLCLQREASRYWSDRVYETLGRGGILVMPEIEELQLELAGCPSIYWYSWGDFDGLQQRVASLVQRFRRSPEERAALADAGSAWIREHASYHTRVHELLEALGLEPAGAWL